jgi:hypothetical protein
LVARSPAADNRPRLRTRATGRLSQPMNGSPMGPTRGPWALLSETWITSTHPGIHPEQSRMKEGQRCLPPPQNYRP